MTQAQSVSRRNLVAKELSNDQRLLSFFRKFAILQIKRTIYDIDTENRLLGSFYVNLTQCLSILNLLNDRNADSFKLWIKALEKEAGLPNILKSSAQALYSSALLIRIGIVLKGIRSLSDAEIEHIWVTSLELIPTFLHKTEIYKGLVLCHEGLISLSSSLLLRIMF